MRRLIQIAVLLALVPILSGFQPAVTQSQEVDCPAGAPTTQSRVVVFETLMRPG